MNTDAYLLFRLRESRFGLEVSCIREIFPLPALTSAPDAPGDIVGLLNWRGTVLPVMHLDRRLNQPLQPLQLSDRVIVVAWHNLQVGVIVNEVEEVGVLGPEILDTEMSYGRENAVSTVFLKGVAKLATGLVGLLNPDTLIRLADDVAALMWQAEFQTLETVLDILPDQQDVSTSNSPLPAMATTGPAPLANFYELYCPDATPAERAIFQQRAEDLQRSHSQENTENQIALAVIGLSGEYFGLSLDSVREFVNVPTFRPIPCCSERIVGNMNLRGEVMTLIDIRANLQLPQSAQPTVAKAVITQVGEIVAGIAVDAVYDILFLPPDHLAPLPVAVKGAKTAFLKGMAQYQGHLLSVLNVPQLLTADA